jgi:gamma-glutamyl:cysteine ligase YbdK (ATP-grasp superfamily)
MTQCVAELEGQVSPEFLQCQIEVGTQVCQTVAEAGAGSRPSAHCDRPHCRRTRTGAACGFLPPVRRLAQAAFHGQTALPGTGARSRRRGRRMLICGMHVHVGIDDDETRIDLMSQLPYFLPHLLALSTSSPYLEGRRYRAQRLPADGVRQSAPDRIASAVFLLVGIQALCADHHQQRPDRGLHQDLVGPQALRPVSHAGIANLRCLAAA